MVVTLSAGSVVVNDEPLAGIVPMEMGCSTPIRSQVDGRAY
jgi:hypothetical protein